MLFSIGGLATQRFTAAPPVEGTEVKVQGEIPAPLLTFAEEASGDIFVSGLAEYVHVDVYGGFGSLFSGGFTSESVTFKIPPTREADILFRGEAVERVAFNPPEETAHIVLTGEGVVPLRTFSEQPFGVIPVSGVAIEKNTESRQCNCRAECCNATDAVEEVSLQWVCSKGFCCTVERCNTTRSIVIWNISGSSDTR